jgi:hypothetical protein
LISSSKVSENNYVRIKIHNSIHDVNIKVRSYQMKGGGKWYKFLCPLCDKAARRIYLLQGQFACRHCHNLAYRCENRGKTDRAIDMKWKIIHKHTSETNECPLRPKGMHYKTYHKMLNKISEYNKLAFACFFGRKDRGWFLIKLRKFNYLI